MSAILGARHKREVRVITFSAAVLGLASVAVLVAMTGFGLIGADEPEEADNGSSAPHLDLPGLEGSARDSVAATPGGQVQPLFQSMPLDAGTRVQVTLPRPLGIEAGARQVSWSS